MHSYGLLKLHSDKIALQRFLLHQLWLLCKAPLYLNVFQKDSQPSSFDLALMTRIYADARFEYHINILNIHYNDDCEEQRGNEDTGKARMWWLYKQSSFPNQA